MGNTMRTPTDAITYKWIDLQFDKITNNKHNTYVISTFDDWDIQLHVKRKIGCKLFVVSDCKIICVKNNITYVTIGFRNWAITTINTTLWLRSNVNETEHSNAIGKLIRGERLLYSDLHVIIYTYFYNLLQKHIEEHVAELCLVSMHDYLNSLNYHMLCSITNNAEKILFDVYLFKIVAKY